MSLRSLLISSLASLGLLLAVSAPVCAGSIPFGLGSVVGGDSGIEPARSASRGGEPDGVREGASGGYLRSVGTVTGSAAAPTLPAAPPAAAGDDDDEVRPAVPVRAAAPPAAATPNGERKTGHRWQSLVPGAIK
jgi:hypothetical protein